MTGLAHAAGPSEFGAGWDQAYDRRLFEAALERVRAKLDPKAYQVFDLYVLKDQPAREVPRTLGINLARVYLAKHRVQAALRREVRRLTASSPCEPRISTWLCAATGSFFPKPSASGATSSWTRSRMRRAGSGGFGACTTRRMSRSS